MKRHIEDNLQSLPERDAHIIRRRYGLRDGQPRTLLEIGRELGLTKERVRQLESRAMGRLRGTAAVEQLRDYL